MLTISSAEWEVMRVLWAKGQATSSEIIAILAKKLDWSASTHNKHCNYNCLLPCK